jgi:hypothetical protein
MIAFQVLLKWLFILCLTLQALKTPISPHLAGLDHEDGYLHCRGIKNRTIRGVVIDQQEDPQDTHEAKGSDPSDHQVRAQTLVTLWAVHKLSCFEDSHR